MSNVVPIKRTSSLEIVRQGSGLALLRGGEVREVLTRDELPDLVLAAANALLAEKGSAD